MRLAHTWWPKERWRKVIQVFFFFDGSSSVGCCDTGQHRVHKHTDRKQNKCVQTFASFCYWLSRFVGMETIHQIFFIFVIFCKFFNEFQLKCGYHTENDIYILYLYRLQRQKLPCISLWTDGCKVTKGGNKSFVFLYLHVLRRNKRQRASHEAKVHMVIITHPKLNNKSLIKLLISASCFRVDTLGPVVNR